jgi:hypothetical protein
MVPMIRYSTVPASRCLTGDGLTSKEKLDQTCSAPATAAPIVGLPRDRLGLHAPAASAILMASLSKTRRRAAPVRRTPASMASRTLSAFPW